MKGIDLSKDFYSEYGLPSVKEHFPNLVERIAFGLIGEGSECFGFDDKLSTDHDFEPGFCMWLTDEDYQEYGFKLERLYAKLPKEFNGYNRAPLSPVGGNRHGVIKIGEFYSKFLGIPNAPTDDIEWFNIPHETLATATNGVVFKDDLGVFSSIREKLKQGYPQDVRLKKMCAHLVYMAQSGQYNYGRAVTRQDFGSAQLCLFEFVKNAISMVYLINNVYEPFYKWVFKGMKNLSVLNSLEPLFLSLIENDNSQPNYEKKVELIRQISSSIVEQLRNQGLLCEQNLCDTKTVDLESVAYTLQNKIRNANIRNMHIMEGI